MNVGCKGFHLNGPNLVVVPLPKEGNCETRVWVEVGRRWGETALRCDMRARGVELSSANLVKLEAWNGSTERELLRGLRSIDSDFKRCAEYPSSLAAIA